MGSVRGTLTECFDQVRFARAPNWHVRDAIWRQKRCCVEGLSFHPILRISICWLA